MSHQPHIASAFDRDLEAVQALIMKMGGLVEAAILDCARALETRDEELARQVVAGDKVIDALEAQVNDETARLIALRSPTATDLRTALTVMKIAGSLERMGDYAKNIAKRSTVLSQSAPIGGTAGTARRMAKLVEQMLKDALDAYIRRDVALAADVRQRDKDVDQIYNTLFRVLLTHMLEDPRAITNSMHLHFIAKNLERMGDHSTSIAEQVIYLVTGELPDEARPKGDSTAFVTSAKD
ncbi:phosphate uptake regulator, PhoU [Gemmobacter megaterium]|uniref:Phosphate-specific transport system accessory protein PhoU n=1 Tax=Gemmobacter megaterium TaxID=1086013 RepID=A0A1N7M0W3_9RHOB|nr:phosphate signaling complex protein PhoU [Gemmobacter megaterium]GGE09440.1 phosphate transport system regulatory protein PhoU [Gemmobacter megaterium]SIS79714.1 phosphate uptake regulator, PhoU [Gemmobacter megaterium]